MGGRLRVQGYLITVPEGTKPQQNPSALTIRQLTARTPAGSPAPPTRQADGLGGKRLERLADGAAPGIQEHLRRDTLEGEDHGVSMSSKKLEHGINALQLEEGAQQQWNSASPVARSRGCADSAAARLSALQPVAGGGQPLAQLLQPGRVGAGRVLQRRG